jgi:hypothetical protein
MLEGSNFSARDLRIFVAQVRCQAAASSGLHGILSGLPGIDVALCEQALPASHSQKHTKAWCCVIGCRSIVFGPYGAKCGPRLHAAETELLCTELPMDGAFLALPDPTSLA